MSLTLQVEDGLAEELRQQASAEQTSVEELAHRLMRDALQERIAAKRWQSQNRRRLELIARRLQGPLTAEEVAELHQLQTLVGERVAPFDRVLLQTAADMRREIEQLPEDAVP
jgi:hypothetical protein